MKMKKWKHIGDQKNLKNSFIFRRMVKIFYWYKKKSFFFIEFFKWMNGIFFCILLDWPWISNDDDADFFFVSIINFFFVVKICVYIMVSYFFSLFPCLNKKFFESTHIIYSVFEGFSLNNLHRWWLMWVGRCIHWK